MTRHGEAAPVPFSPSHIRPDTGTGAQANIVGTAPAAPGVARHDATPASGGVATSAQPAPAAPDSTAPAAQLSSALAVMHSTQDGAKHVTVRLDPAELGQVQVRITRAQDGTASVSVSVERPETLRSLQADLSHLHQALDRAGLPEQRSLSLHLTSPELGMGTSGSGGQPGSQAGSQQQDAKPGAPTTRGSGPPAGTVVVPGQPAPARWLRAGVNITA